MRMRGKKRRSTTRRWRRSTPTTPKSTTLYVRPVDTRVPSLAVSKANVPSCLFTLSSLHLQGSQNQLKEVWEEADGLDPEDFDPKTFFKLHGSLQPSTARGLAEVAFINQILFSFCCVTFLYNADTNGDGYFDEQEMEALFTKEVKMLHLNQCIWAVGIAGNFDSIQYPIRRAIIRLIKNLNSYIYIFINAFPEHATHSRIQRSRQLSRGK